MRIDDSGLASELVEKTKACKISEELVVLVEFEVDG